MGEYKFSMYAKWQIGLMVSYQYSQILIHLPFVVMHISTSRDSKGIEIFGKYF
jgi:hypothetical protein